MDSIRIPYYCIILFLYLCFFGILSRPFSAQAQGPPLPPSTHIPRLQLQAIGSNWGSITYGEPVTRLMSFEVSGQDLSDTVHIIAPEFFEIRLDSLFGPFMNRISIPAAGQLSPTRFFVHLRDSLPAGTYSGELLALSSGQLGVAALIQPALVSPRALQLVGLQALNKEYDGNYQASVGGQAAFFGLVYGQQFSPALMGIQWTFLTSNADTGISVVPTGSIPPPNSNYLVNTPNMQASILRKRLTIGGLTAQNKSYDGGVSVNITGSPQYVGLVNGEVFGQPSTGTWTFENKRVGAQKEVRPTTPFTPPSNNYLIDSVVLRADISPAVLSIQSAVARNKIYDRTTQTTVDSVVVTGILPNDTVYLTSNGSFQQFQAGNQIPVTLNIQLSGPDGANYTVSAFSGLSATISPRPVNIGGLVVAEKEFDGTRTATLLGVPQLLGVIQGDENDLVLGGTPIALFATPDTGRNIPVTVSGFQLLGAAARNYVLSQPTGLLGNIVLSVLAAWSFQPVRGTLQQPEANVGQGTMSLVGSMSTTSWSGGMNNHNGCGNASTTSAGDTAWSIGTTNPGSTNESSGVQMMLSSLLYRNIKLVWEQRWSGSSPNTVRVQYTTNGSQWVNVHLTDSNTTYCMGRIDNGRFETDSAADKFRRIQVDFSQIPQLNEQPILGFRIVAAHFRNTGAFRQVVNPSTNATAGAWRFDNIRITGNRATPTVWNGVVWSQGPPDTGVHAIVSAPLRITQHLFTNRLELDSGVVLGVDSGASLVVRGSFINRGILQIMNGRTILRNTYSGSGVIRGGLQATLEWQGNVDAGTVFMDSLTGKNGRTLEKLVLQMGAQGRIRLGNQMIIHRLVDLNGGILQTQDRLCLSSSSDTLTAQIRGGTNGSIQGKVETERYLPWIGQSHSGYRFMGSPHRTAIPFSQVDGLPSSPNGVIRFSEPLNSYLSVPLGNNQWNPAQAFGIWTDSIQTIRLTGEPQLSASGPYFLQNQSARWNLMGNPFPCSMAWDSVQKTNTEHAVWVWKKDSLIPGAGIWASYINGVGSHGANGILAPLQGFMVRAGASGLSSLFYPISARQPYYFSGFMRQNQQDPRIIIELEQATPYFKEESLIQLKADATSGFDSHQDAGYLGDETVLSPSLASLDINGYAYSIQSIPDPAGLPRVIPLRTQIGQSGAYQLQLNTSNWPSSSPIFLEDRVLQRIETVLGSISYSYLSNGPADSLRFRIHLNSVGADVEEDKLSEVQIYFHNGVLHVRRAEDLRRIEIRDLSGKLVHVWQPEGVQEILLTPVLARGVYSVTLCGNRGSMTRKLLK